MTIESVPVDQLVVDAATYQFKGGGDDAGVTDRLLGVSVWDAFAAATSPLLVHRRLDGRLCVVDGHQRTGLAKRLRVPTVQAVVVDETTTTVGAARRLGARLNLQQGTGTAIDIAKLLKTDPLSGEERATIPTDSLSGGLMRTGEGLVRLHEAAFRRVVNGLVHPHPGRNAAYGAIVGRLIADEAEQVAALQRLADVSPDSEFQAEAFVRAILADGFERGEQSDLFGTSAVATSLAEPIAQILTATRKVLQTDKVALAAALRHEDRLTAVGNVLNTAGNEAGVRLAAAHEAGLQAFAHTVGPVRAELKRVAAAVGTRTITLKSAAEAVIRALKAEAPQPFTPAAAPESVTVTGWDVETLGQVVLGVLAEPRAWGRFVPHTAPVIKAGKPPDPKWISAFWKGEFAGRPVTLELGLWRAPEKTGVPIAAHAGLPPACGTVGAPPGTTLVQTAHHNYFVVPVPEVTAPAAAVRQVTAALAERMA